jgi:hypothetical protein
LILSLFKLIIAYKPNAMSIISRARLSSLTEIKLGPQQFSATLSEARNQAKSLARVTIFLSHSHSDADKADVQKVSVLLRRVAGSIYIDRNDSGLPVTTGAETAARLKNKIKECRKFILLASDNAINSKWCNWELGFGDAQKYLAHIALFPIKENYSGYQGMEYLKIHPRIEESGDHSETYVVIYPDGRSFNLLNWLNA